MKQVMLLILFCFYCWLVQVRLLSHLPERQHPHMPLHSLFRR